MKMISKVIISMMMVLMLVGCGTVKNEAQDDLNPSGNSKSSTSETVEIDTSESKITGEMAYEGVNNYCHIEFDWSIAEENPEIMYVAMGEESETEYQVIFRSYTGAFRYFYVDKMNGTTRMVEYVPTLDIKNEVGTINLYYYLKINEEGNQEKIVQEKDS